MLEKGLALLNEAIFDRNPPPALKFVAMYLLSEYDRSRLPDWVEALANGNLDAWDAVVDEVRRFFVAEEMEDDGSDIDF